MLQRFPHGAARCANARVSEEGRTWSVFGGESSEQVTGPLALTPRAVALGTRQRVATWCSLGGKKPRGCKCPSAFLWVMGRGWVLLETSSFPQILDGWVGSADYPSQIHPGTRAEATSWRGALQAGEGTRARTGRVWDSQDRSKRGRDRQDKDTNGQDRDRQSKDRAGTRRRGQGGGRQGRRRQSKGREGQAGQGQAGVAAGAGRS